MSTYRFETVDRKIAQRGDTVYIEEGDGFVDRIVRTIHRNYIDLLSKRGKVIQRGKGECWKEKP